MKLAHFSKHSSLLDGKLAARLGGIGKAATVALLLAILLANRTVASTKMAILNFSTILKGSTWRK